MLRKASFYFNWAYRTIVRRESIPLNGSLILTDLCNLNCRHCTVAHLGYEPRSLAEVISDLATIYATGARVLVITGGEPYAWRDGDGKTVEDVVAAARSLGFFRVVICTNGTFPLESSADYLWVSLDGMETVHNAIRGTVYDTVLANVEGSRHRRIYVNFTVSAENLSSFPEAAERILGIRNVRGILFHLFTKYVGGDEALSLGRRGRAEAIRGIRAFKKRHPLKTFNTFAGLRALETDRWERRTSGSVTVNRGEVTDCCCREGIYDDATCRDCGCTPAVETWVLKRMKPSAIIENLRFF
jgi:MoaA/NifB/PqqE/SkfB family radical SAM enzyme